MGTASVVEPDRLDRILTDPAIASREEAAIVLRRASKAIPELCTKAMGADDDDETIDLRRAAALIGRSARWIRESAERLPFMIRVGQGWRCSRRKVQAWLDAGGNR